MDCLSTFSGAMTRTAFRTTVSRLRQFAVRADAGLRVQAPKQAVVAGEHGRVRLGQNELAFPAQRRTQVRMSGVETRFPNHAAPPDAAFIMALATATRASFTLYALWLSGLALARAASAAFCAVSLLTGFPARTRSASGEGHGTGATYPKTTRADSTLEPRIFRATLATASGQSKTSFCRIS